MNASISIVCVDLGSAALISSGEIVTYWSFSYSKPLTTSSFVIASPVLLFTCLLPTGFIVRLSRRLNFRRCSAVAECSVTGMWTRPKLIAPFHSVRELVGAMARIVHPRKAHGCRTRLHAAVRARSRYDVAALIRAIAWPDAAFGHRRCWPTWRAGGTRKLSA